MKKLFPSIPYFRTLLSKIFCNAGQSFAIGHNDSCHNLASPIKVRQNLSAFTPSEELWVSIQSFVQRKCDSASSSGLPENSGLKYNQFNTG